MSREKEKFDYFDNHCPERKLELIDGRLIVGNGVAGSRLLLDHLLRGWGARAVVALGSVERWMEALSKTYSLSPPDRIDDQSLGVLGEKASRIDYSIEDFTQGEEGEDAGHWRVRSHLFYWLYEASESLGGIALGRDFVMRAGEDGLTPDAIFFKGGKLNTLYEYYLDGPAEMVIEVVRPAHRNYDLHIKRELYARAGVPEYIIVDPENKSVEFLRLAAGDYISLPPDADGLYRPQSVTGLAIAPQNFWVEREGFSIRGEDNPFIVEATQPVSKSLRGARNGKRWGELPFESKMGLHPVRISFDEYISWCPEAKFEFWNGQIQICSDEGVRNIVGMLMMTLGMIETSRFASPSEWVSAIRWRLNMEARDAELRCEWRERASQAAFLLRSKYSICRIAITGDLLSSSPLNFWSRLQLVAWDVDRQDSIRIYEDLSPMDISVIEGEGRYFQEQIERGEMALEEI
jgi:Uma2 family endonuclease